MFKCWSCRYRHLVRLQIWFFKGGRGNVSLFLTYIMWYIKIYVFDGADYENNIKNFQYWSFRGIEVILYCIYYIYHVIYQNAYIFDAVDYENDINNFQFWFLRGGWVIFYLFYTYIMWYTKIYVFDGVDYENDIKNF